MSTDDIIIGFIQEPLLGPRWMTINDALIARNREVIAALPSDDAWPPLHRGWFAASDAIATFRSSIIHLGGSLKRDDDGWDEFVSKFERLLAQLHWEQAMLRRETAFTGHYEHRWTVGEEWEELARSGNVAPMTPDLWSREDLLPSPDDATP